MEEDRSAFKILKDKRPGKRHVGRSRRRWEDNITMNIKVMGINMRNLVHLSEDRDYCE